MTDDPRADDDRVRHPFRLGLIVSSTVLAAYGVAATIRLLRYGEILADADWRLLIAIPACLVPRASDMLTSGPRSVPGAPTPSWCGCLVCCWWWASTRWCVT